MIQTVVSNASAPEYGQATISFPIREEDYPSARAVMLSNRHISVANKMLIDFFIVRSPLCLPK